MDLIDEIVDIFIYSNKSTEFNSSNIKMNAFESSLRLINTQNGRDKVSPKFTFITIVQMCRII